MPLLIHGLRGGHTHTHTQPQESDFKFSGNQKHGNHISHKLHVNKSNSNTNIQTNIQKNQTFAADLLCIRAGRYTAENRKEGIFVIPVSISSKKIYTGKLTYRKNTGIP